MGSANGQFLQLQTSIALALILLLSFHISSDSTPIAHGSPAAPCEYPFLVQVITHAGKLRSPCSGSIIAPNLILTAAHCVDLLHRLDSENDYRTFVIAGEHLWGNLGGPATQVRQVVDIVRHDEYDRRTYHHDLAILVLSEDLKYGQCVSQVNLPQDGAAFIGNAEISGWGEYEAGRPWADKLQRATVPILNGSACTGSPFINYNDRSMMCAGGNWTDMCNGDSGGPLLCTDDNDHRQYLCGVMFTGLALDCGNFSIPAVYTRVSASAHVTWIQNLIRGYIPIQCSSGQFDCGNRHCVRRREVCNGVKECGTGLDEAGCGPCKSDEFRCATNDNCVPIYSVCNGTANCGDGSDELGCGHCASTEFSCRDTRCVSPFCGQLHWVLNYCHTSQCISNITFPCPNGDSPLVKCTKKVNGNWVLGYRTCASGVSAHLGPWAWRAWKSIFVIAIVIWLN